jgi:hypothetical protein
MVNDWFQRALVRFHDLGLCDNPFLRHHRESEAPGATTWARAVEFGYPTSSGSIGCA